MVLEYGAGLCTHGRPVRGRQWCNGLRVLDDMDRLPTQQASGSITHGEFAGELEDTIPYKKQCRDVANAA